MNAQRTPHRHRSGSRAPRVLFTRTLRADPFAVRRALMDCIARLDAICAPDTVGRAELVLAEIMNNVAEHGRLGRSSRLPVLHLAVFPQDDGVACAVSDNGRRMPTRCFTRAELPRLGETAGAIPLQTLPEGGFGCGIIRKLTDTLIYFHHGERNCLAFTIVEADRFSLPG